MLEVSTRTSYRRIKKTIQQDIIYARVRLRIRRIKNEYLYRRVMKIEKKIKCECNTLGELKPEMVALYDKKKELPYVNHKPNECKCTNDLKQHIRDGKKLWLCSCCCLTGDKEIKHSHNDRYAKEK